MDYQTQQDVNPDCTFADLLVRQFQTSEPEVILPKVKKVPWSQHDSKKLTGMFERGDDYPSMASELNRSVDAVKNQVRKLNLRRFKQLNHKDLKFLKQNYWLLGATQIAKKLKREPAAIRYYAKQLGLKHRKTHDSEPPIPRQLLPYDMVKRVAVLERECPESQTKVEDSVVIFYDKKGPSAPMMAMHLDELCSALDKYFGRRNGVTSSALMYGYKAV
ncbi:gcrA cell cycle regulator family protein [Vibrio methylphosphonaticus]|uniref:gcrA cell cycle regulator family protein n=1 Tax=Vibrio methylphosphonaticus TaxID=2946866 RepID=UPI00202A3499|nr:gcrA cell cycle regulator family protein [Vibrio methylphosphonaticus]MCL9777607.1 gcrA cell cycle regulator family protein [Vibrio methylphosphonaticus]